MSIKDLYNHFGYKKSIESEKQEFVNRTLSFFRKFINTFVQGQYGEKDFFLTVCFQLGANGQEIIDQYNRRSSFSEQIPDIIKAFEFDFFNTLKLIVAIRKYYSTHEHYASTIDDAVQDILSMCVADLSISYQNGMFFPKGEEVLDKELIGYSFKILADYPNEDKDLRKALENYTSGSKYGVVENCYRCIEGLLRLVLKNKKSLIDNKTILLRELNLSSHWKGILAQYIEYGNDFGRHASENRHEFSEAEVEAYLYTTCLLVRLIIRIK
jgi:hypothetical protein